MRYQFASGRLSFLFSPSDVVVSSGGSVSTATTLYFAIQGENPAGVNLLSDVVGPVAIAVGEKVEITIPEAVSSPAQGWESYIVSASTTGVPESFVQLAAIAACDAGGNPLSLPLTVELSSDDHLLLSGIVANPAALPPLPIDGALRAVSSLSGQVFRYDSASILTPNGLSILSAGIAGGAWLASPGNFSSYVAATTDAGGCDRPLSEISGNLIRAPRYAMGGADGRQRRFWIVNSGSDIIPSGRRVILSVKLNDVPSDAFDGLLRTVFHGYVNTVDWTLRTQIPSGDPFPDVADERLYESGKTDSILPDDVQPGEAYSFSVYPNFYAAELNNAVTPGAILKVGPSISAQAGRYTEIGAALGVWIYSEYDKGWVVPGGGLSARCLKRSGIVSSRSFLGVGVSLVSGIQPSTSGQNVVINGNGAVFWSLTIEQNEALRAIVGTASGYSPPSEWSDAVTLAGGTGLRVTCGYPSNGTVATIRTDYPDAIAGLAGKAKLTASAIAIYVEIGGVIKRFSGLPFLDDSSQVFDLNDWDAGTTVFEPSGSASSPIGLFQPGATSVASYGTGGFPSGLCRVAFAFQYTGDAISSISHSELEGCIHVAALTFAEMEAACRYWAQAVTSDSLPAIPQQSVVAYQSRQTELGQAVFKPSSLRAASSGTVWRPVWLSESDPGRWEIELQSGPEVVLGLLYSYRG